MRTSSLNPAESGGSDGAGDGNCAPNPTSVGDSGHHDLAKFAAAIFEPTDLVELRMLPGKSQRWMPASELASAETLTWLGTRNAAGDNVYVGANPRSGHGGTAADVALARCLFVDFDDGVMPEKALAAINAAQLPEPTVVLASGGGTHCYWRLMEPITDLATFTRVQKGLIALLGTDKCVHDGPRVMRAPGFVNHKYPHKPVATLVFAQPDGRYPISSFPVAGDDGPSRADAGDGSPHSVAARIAFGSDNRPNPGGKAGLSRATLEFLQFGVGKGSRNQRCFSAACDYSGCGIPQAEAERDLQEAARLRGMLEPGDFDEVQITESVRSAYSKPRTPARPTDLAASQTSAGEKRASVGSVSPDPQGSPESWPAPRPLPDALPPVMEFDPDLLPKACRPWIVDIADRVQCPIDFPAVAVMIALAGTVGRRIGIRPKKYDNWLVVPNLWGGGIGRPGVMKTPAIQEPLKPVKQLEIAAKAAYEAAVADAEAAKLVGDLRKKDAEKEIKKHLKNPDEAYRLARESLEGGGDEPVRTRYIVNDSSVEKLGEILNQNPSGVTIYRDELVGLLKSLDKDGQEGARSFYLEAWNGTGRYTFDRIGRGTIDIEAAIVSIIGGIQPGPLGQYLRGAAREGVGDDGLMQRFQLMVWPDISRAWVNVDRWPDSEAKKSAYAIFDGLSQLEPILLGADTDPMEPDGIPFLRFATEAQDMFDAWRARLEHTVRSGDLHPALESHLSKYRSLIPSLALLIHLADGGTGAVGVEPLDKAIRWGVYLQSHAERIYSQAIHPDIAAARALAKRVLAGEVEDRFALRDIYRKGWSGLATADDAQEAVEVLIDLGWLREIKHPTQGRTGTVYLISPRIGDTAGHENPDPPPEGTDKADRSPPSGSSVSPDPEGPSKNEGDWGVV